MSIVDIILIAIFLLSLVSGMQKGFVASILATIGFVGAWIASQSLYGILFNQFDTAVNFKNWCVTTLEITAENYASIFRILSFVVVFVVAYAVILLVVNLINSTFRFPKLRGVDALAGGLFGLLRGYAVVCLLAAVCLFVLDFLKSEGLNDMLKGSKIASFFLYETGNKLSDLFNIGGRIQALM